MTSLSTLPTCNNETFMSVTGAKYIANDIHNHFNVVEVVEGVDLQATVKLTDFTVVISGVYCKRPFYARFFLGGEACYHSYNLFYFGLIEKFTTKTVTLYTSEGNKRLTWKRFVELNNRSLEEMKLRNGETMETI